MSQGEAAEARAGPAAGPPGPHRRCLETPKHSLSPRWDHTGGAAPGAAPLWGNLLKGLLISIHVNSGLASTESIRLSLAAAGSCFGAGPPILCTISFSPEASWHACPQSVLLVWPLPGWWSRLQLPPALQLVLSHEGLCFGWQPPHGVRSGRTGPCSKETRACGAAARQNFCASRCRRPLLGSWLEPLPKSSDLASRSSEGALLGNQASQAASSVAEVCFGPHGRSRASCRVGLGLGAAQGGGSGLRWADGPAVFSC